MHFTNTGKILPFIMEQEKSYNARNPNATFSSNYQFTAVFYVCYTKLVLIFKKISGKNIKLNLLFYNASISKQITRLHQSAL